MGVLQSGRPVQIQPEGDPSSGLGADVASVGKVAGTDENAREVVYTVGSRTPPGERGIEKESRLPEGGPERWAHLQEVRWAQQCVPARVRRRWEQWQEGVNGISRRGANAAASHVSTEAKAQTVSSL